MHCYLASLYCKLDTFGNIKPIYQSRVECHSFTCLFFGAGGCQLGSYRYETAKQPKQQTTPDNNTREVLRSSPKWRDKERSLLVLTAVKYFTVRYYFGGGSAIIRHVGLFFGWWYMKLWIVMSHSVSLSSVGANICFELKCLSLWSTIFTIHMVDIFTILIIIDMFHASNPFLNLLYCPSSLRYLKKT